MLTDLIFVCIQVKGKLFEQCRLEHKKKEFLFTSLVFVAKTFEDHKIGENKNLR